MRKKFPIVLCLVLIGMVLAGSFHPVSAAGSAHMSLSSSSGTVYRGDSFTVSVSLSNDQPVSNGGVILSYDSSVFELLGGSCHVSNAALAEVSAANGGGVFVLQTDAPVSGTIFTINMRVKDDAAFGSYSISGSPSLSISCSFSGTSVTVACHHSYANCTKVDGNQHESTCSACGEKKSDAHTWDSGTVTKAATCKDPGSKKLTCTGCGATKEESVPVTNDHKYGSWTSAGTSGHSRTCTLCGKKDSSSHRWNSGTVTKKATCQATGTKKLTCSDCGATKNETISKTAHSHSTSTYVDETNHKYTCTDCGNEFTEAHRYSDTWQHDENWHFLHCDGCGHDKDLAAHIPGPKATETTDQICTVCSRILKPMGAHVHSFAEEWSTDETGHWHNCSDCDEKDSAGPHVFDDDCDTDCNVCAMTREPLHTIAEEWSADATGHWRNCQNCGEKLEFSPHTPGAEATITSNQVCTVCQFEIAPIVPHDHIFDEQGTLHSHFCPCGAVYEADMDDCVICEPFPWWIVCIAEAVVFGGVIIGLIVRMKKRGAAPAQEPAEQESAEEDPTEQEPAEEESTEQEPAEEESTEQEPAEQE